MEGFLSGTFANYSMSGIIGDYPDDEDAVVSAAQDMLSMCGNPGQEVLIGDNLDWFDEWALDILENEQSTKGNTFGEFATMVLDECYGGDLQKWWGTYQIWFEGWAAIAEQSGYHDARDEMGEGTGAEF